MLEHIKMKISLVWDMKCMLIWMGVYEYIMAADLMH